MRFKRISTARFQHNFIYVNCGRRRDRKTGWLIAVGWVGKKINDWDEGDFTWGGNMVVHEIKQNSAECFLPFL